MRKHYEGKHESTNTEFHLVLCMCFLFRYKRINITLYIDMNACCVIIFLPRHVNIRVFNIIVSESIYELLPAHVELKHGYISC